MSESKQREMAGAPTPAQAEAVVNPTAVNSVDDLPSDHIALLVWREITGPQPMTIVITRASWDMNKQVLMDNGFQFEPKRVYEFESPTNEKGRKTIFHLAGVVGWMANIDTGIVPAR